ncbi:DNA double-strand break repair protein Mre11 [Halopiger xanaduensis]|uniref:DNA double-strand break repair protein Mre11 n=1 Tax=Halopiger xanaduensis (strain DSM 18323 / JCM 14033 / SH-6) TaxID=797210 RepID=F8D491_HALXS|nr:DNA double-strand break repair protein Mre11 [Halopiger xanaduensis]AEH37496.1 metallophosphoesterase [Halopiger xanaduensis SH-6]
MTRVIHTGDTHIGYQQYNSPERRRDFLAAFRGVVEDAVDDDVDAVIHAGDLFHDRRPGLLDLQGTIDILRTLADADIPFLAVVGNHEGKRDAQWLDLFADLGLATRLGADPEVVGDVAFYGLDFVPRSRREDLEYEFEPVPDAADRTALVSHGLFEPFAHADWDTERLLAESTVDFDAVLLGDNHAPDTADVQDAWVTYCGSTERASASEREDRGYNLVEFDDEVAISRRAIAETRDFVFVDVELEADEGIDRVQERVRQHDPGLEDAVVIVTIEGEGRPITPAAVEELAIDRGALVARVNDRRELPDEDEEVSVSFADPDAAVRERVRDLGLSDAALEIDETVRNDDLADANVRESVERRVRDLLEEDDSAFEPAPEREPSDEDVTTVADQLRGDAGTEPAADADSTADAAAAGSDATAEAEASSDDAAGAEPADEAVDETPAADDAAETGDEEPADADTASLGDFA